MNFYEAFNKVLGSNNNRLVIAQRRFMDVDSISFDRCIEVKADRFILLEKDCETVIDNNYCIKPEDMISLRWCILSDAILNKARKKVW